ncbi:MAG TPA: glycosyltransferase [Armatimonadetes bacterium]|nr:glycosyltransferase [Armatimonadota bacterium]
MNERPGERQLSVVIPVYNEADNVGKLYAQLRSVLNSLGRSWEVIFVDDGSTDGTFAQLKALYQRQSPAAEGGRLRVLRFRRNFGKAAALAAGFEAAQGEVVLTMDGDLQDDPQEIPKFLRQLEEGFDLVSGWKKQRRDPFSKRWPSRVFNWAVSLLTGLSLHDLNCGFKAYRREVIQRLQARLYGELHRYIPVLAHAQGYRVGEIVVAHRPRQRGRSKYGWERFLRGFLDLLTVILLTRYATRPLHFFGGTGLLVFLAGLGINLYLTVLWFLHYRPIGTRPLLMLGVLLMILGVQLISIGLIGEMIVSRDEPRRKIYVIEKRLE